MALVEEVIADLCGGPAALAAPAACDRLRRCNRAAMRELAGRLRYGAGAPQWSDPEILALILKWRSLREFPGHASDGATVH